MTEVRNHHVTEPDPDDYDEDQDPPALVCSKCGLGGDTEDRFRQVSCSGGDD